MILGRCEMNGRFRTPLQGANMILWPLCTKKEIESGRLYFDKKETQCLFFIGYEKT